MKTKQIIAIVFILLCWLPVLGQEDELEPVGNAITDLGSLFGDTEKGITKVRLLSNTEKSVNVEVLYQGFDDKSYTMKGSILNRLKKPIKEIEPVTFDLPEGRGSADLRFNFKQREIGYQQTFLESQFLSITFYERDNFLGSLDLGGEGLLGSTYLFKLNKKWRISGNGLMVVTINLVPYPSAINIQP